MSNDASPDDQRAQSTHALEMKVERKLQKDTGYNRHQIRSALHGSVTDFVNQVNRINVGHPEKQIDLPEVKHSPPQILPPLPFSITNKEPAIDKIVNEDLGSASNPYIMGTNSTHVANPSFSQDDSWDFEGGPTPAGGGPWDGVICNPTRFVLDPDPDHSVSKVAMEDGGGTFTISTQIVLVYTRALTFDSAGKLLRVSAEDNGFQLSLTFLT